MKHECPSCRGPGIAGLPKRWSAREHPATCAICGGLSHVVASTSSGIVISSVLLFITSLIAVLAATLAPWLATALAVCLSIAFNVWAWRRAEMFPIPKKNAKAAASVSWALLGIYAVLGLFS